MAITHVEAEVSSMGLVLDPFQRTLRPARLRLAAVGSPAASA